jgi:hypothetical protein
MVKKILFVLCTFFLLLCVASLTRAAEFSSANIRSGFGLGIDFAKYTGTDFALMFNYNSERLTAGLGFNYEDDTGNRVPRNWWEWRAQLGLRYLLYSRLFLTGGGAWSYTTRRNNAIGSGYAIGPYVGIDYYFIKRLFLSFKILPYTYVKDPDGDTGSSYFEHGSISLNFTFW